MNLNSRISLFIFLALSLSVFSCKTKATLVQPAVEEVIEERELEPIVISEPRVEPEEVIVYELPKYNPSYPLDIDIIHTKLDLRFDWAQQHVLGKATLTIKPYFYPTSLMTLDAVGFDINRVSLGKNGTPLKYEYNDQYLDVQLDRIYTREEQVEIYIDYVAKPNENPVGGSAAITSDKGLFFINPLGENKEKPMQIWTQGETENNSR
jgi:aminopeptidase N